MVFVCAVVEMAASLDDAPGFSANEQDADGSHSESVCETYMEAVSNINKTARVLGQYSIQQAKHEEQTVEDFEDLSLHISAAVREIP